ATATSLTFQVPPGTASGPITVATVDGKATSADFVIPPFAYLPADVEQTRRIDPGSSGSVAVTGAGKIALVLFSASLGQRVSIATTGTQNVTADVSLIAPDGSLIWGTAPAYGGNTFTDAVSITQTGTYTFVLDPQGTTTNTWTVNVYDVPPDASATVAPGDPAVNLSTTVPGPN